MFKLNLFVAFIAIALAAAGCGAPPTNPPANSAVNQTANTATPQPSATPETTATPDTAGITLPMLEALFADEEFLKEAKTQQNLSDDEIKKLTDAARTATSQLAEDGVEDDNRSTKAASDDAAQQVLSILGRDKGTKFLTFISQRIAGDTTAPASSDVPTDSRIVVNAPAYRMDVFQNGNLIKTYKIGIGYPEFPLPSGLRSAKAIIFNPTWTPPDEPWVKGKLEPYKMVEAGDKLNPLGPIKIPIGSPSLIHGGKSPAKLGGFASHGCVGLTNGQVQDFATVLSSLSAKPISITEVRAYAKNKTETKEVPLDKPIPVELRYETIVVENGVLKLYRDVYERGTNTEAKLRDVLSKHGLSLDSLDPAIRGKIIDGLAQMSRGATGKTVERSNTNTTEKSKTDTVTRNIKGKKELSFPLAELAGKGYPAAKNLSSQ